MNNIVLLVVLTVLVLVIVGIDSHLFRVYYAKPGFKHNRWMDAPGGGFILAWKYRRKCLGLHKYETFQDCFKSEANWDVVIAWKQCERCAKSKLIHILK